MKKPRLKVGDPIYIGATEVHTGGLVTVGKIKKEMRRGKATLYMTPAEFPREEFNIVILRAHQKRLRNTCGDKKAQAIPDGLETRPVALALL